MPQKASMNEEQDNAASERRWSIHRAFNVESKSSPYSYKNKKAAWLNAAFAKLPLNKTGDYDAAS
jgi:hypothetical protein